MEEKRANNDRRNENRRKDHKETNIDNRTGDDRRTGNDRRDQYLHIILKLGVNEDMERHMNKSKSFDFIEFINLPNKIKQELLEEDEENKRLKIINRIFKAVMSISNFGSNRQQISEA